MAVLAERDMREHKLRARESREAQAKRRAFAVKESTRRATELHPGGHQPHGFPRQPPQKDIKFRRRKAVASSSQKRALPGTGRKYPKSDSEEARIRERRAFADKEMARKAVERQAKEAAMEQELHRKLDHKLHQLQAGAPSPLSRVSSKASPQGSHDLTWFPDLDIVHTPKYQELLTALEKSPEGSGELFSFPSLGSGSSPRHREMMDMIRHELVADIAEGPASQRLARKRKACRKGQKRARK
ncbi:hypothetical protein WJX74_010118 [Apatococcus lobatus]|uniref:Uncharacterized protein n=1 Tax=Apatococcus lobatus TaxID=904363 RepID=A0AAW1RC59_9CHLO